VAQPGASITEITAKGDQQGDRKMPQCTFDDRSIKWNTLALPPVGELKHLQFSILSVDELNYNVHVLFKFAANEKIILHRHMIHNNTFVVQGEHRLYEPDGTLKEVRPTGMYKSTPAGDVHLEGGGPDQDVVVLFDMRGRDGVFYELLDDDQNVVASLSYADFLGAYKAQSASQ
jgi:quercetin dioxygenase-like cupin family protein